MVLSKEEVKKILKDEEDKLEELLKAKDTVGLSELYHPDAVLVHRGVRTYYGREEIQKAYEPFTKMIVNLSPNPYYAAEADNGEYLIRKNTYTVNGNGKVFEYEQIYKKVDGKYLIYHEEFTFEP